MTKWLIGMMLLCACSGGRKVTETPVLPPEPARPSWVSARPVVSGYYVGIGMATKSRPEPLETAKKNALNDLASEISVTVEGNSLLYTLDRQTNFDETFTSTIRTRSNEQLAGFELVDTWENGSDHWTYYRLSKSEHARLKAEKKATAMANAMDLRARSQESIAKGELRGAIDQNLKALIAMKDYWGENDPVEINGVQVPLVNQLYSDLQGLTAGVRLDVLPERCELGYGNRFKRELLISASYIGNGSSRSLVQLPLFITYPGTGGNVTELKNTDVEGRARTTIHRVDAGAERREVVVKPHLDEIISRDMDRSLVNALVSSLTVPEKHVMIDLEMPKVHMKSAETNLGEPIGDAGVATAIREEMTAKGFRFVERSGDADLQMDLNASSRKGGESNGFFTAFLDVSYSFKDRRTGDTVHEGGMQGVKGIQLNYEKAGLESYKKAIPDIRKALVPGIMNSFN